MTGNTLDTGGDEYAAEPAELMVVGDADQSIYAFRGANIRNILAFEEDFPNAETIMLEQNYRSTQTILSARQRGHRAEQGPQAEEPLVRRGRRRADRRLRRRQRARRGAVRRRGDRPADRRQGAPALETSPSSTAPTLRAGCSRKCSSGSACPTRSSAACVSTSAARCATRSPTCGCWSTPTTPCRCAGSSTPPSAASASGPRRASRCSSQRTGTSYWEALRQAEDAPAIATRSLKNIEGFVAMIEELQAMVETGARPDEVLEAVLTKSGYLAELEESDDPQDETRVENLGELVAVAREFADEHRGRHPRRLPRAGRAGRRLRPDPRRGRVRRRRHADDAAHREGAGVPRRLPDRARGRDLPALALAR